MGARNLRILACFPGPETPNTATLLRAEDRSEEPEDSCLFPRSRNSEHYFFVLRAEVRSTEPDDETGCPRVVCGCLALVSGSETPNTTSC